MKRDITVLLDTAALLALRHPRGSEYVINDTDLADAESAVGRPFAVKEIVRLETLIQNYLEHDMVDAHVARVKLAVAS